MRLDFSEIRGLDFEFLPLLNKKIKNDLLILFYRPNSELKNKESTPCLFIEDPNLPFNMQKISIEKEPKILDGSFVKETDLSEIFEFISNNEKFLIDLWDEGDFLRFFNNVGIKTVQLNGVFESIDNHSTELNIFVRKDKNRNGKNDILHISESISQIFPSKPFSHFDGTIAEWEHIMKKLTPEEQHYFLHDTIGFNPIKWELDLDTIIERIHYFKFEIPEESE